MTPWFLLGVPVDYTKEDVTALLLAHQNWAVTVKGLPKKNGARTHKWNRT